MNWGGASSSDRVPVPQVAH